MTCVDCGLIEIVIVQVIKRAMYCLYKSSNSRCISNSRCTILYLNVTMKHLVFTPINSGVTGGTDNCINIASFKQSTA